MTKTFDKGMRAEHLAKEYLIKKGYHIFAHRYYGDGCEIDLVSINSTTLVFIEVRYRRTKAIASLSITPQKQNRLLRAAHHFMAHHPDLIKKYPFIRFDVILLSKENNFILHIENAFGESI